MKDLWTPLKLYIMADKFAVPSLKRLTLGRFMDSLKRQWRTVKDLPSIIDYLFTNTVDCEWLIRNEVCNLLGKHVKEADVFATLEPAMLKHADFAVGVIKSQVVLSAKRRLPLR
jgi:site-specific recombinase XerD